MQNSIKICSFNCQSMTVNAAIVQDLMVSCDIICLQETLLDENNCQILDNLDSNFMTAFVPAYRKPGCFVGRSSGGLAICWRRSASFSCIPITYSKRIMGLKITLQSKFEILLLNIYLTCDYGTAECLIDYKSSLAELSDIVETENFNDFYCAGDFNADPTKGRFYAHVSQFVADNFLKIADVDYLPTDSYTYVSQNATCATSWVDHVLCRTTNPICSHEILYGSTFADHIPIIFEIQTPQIINFEHEQYPSPAYNAHKIDWEKVSDTGKHEYSHNLDELCRLVSHDVLLCNVNGCDDPNHISELDDIYSDISDAIFVAALHLPSQKGSYSGNRVVGWNSYCKDLYGIARGKYLTWHRNGRIRFGIEFEDMKAARSAFKNALKFCRNNEQMIKRENLLRKFCSNNKYKFWKDVSKINGNKTRNVVQVDGEVKKQGITDIFNNKYRLILDDPNSQTGEYVDPQLPFHACDGPFLSHDDVNLAISQLNMGLGFDGIHSNHLKFGGKVFKNLIMKFLNKLLNHSYVPKRMAYGEIRPVVKNANMGKHDSDNYRPVMNSSMFLKILEYCLLPILTKNLRLSNCQFGFRENTGCLPAIALVKESIDRYNNDNTDVHSVLIDLSKAFDRINHGVLYQKLLSSNVDPRIVNIIRCMYDNTDVCTSFNNVKSESWGVNNGARQGGILSPLIFSFYINHVLETIMDMSVGCSLNGYKTSIVCYADDIIILAPSAQGVQQILNVLSGMLSDLCLTVNVLKSQYVIFRSNKRKITSSPKVFMNGVQIKEMKQCKYLGVILSGDGNLKHDIDRALNSFLKQFNAMYSKFYFVNKEVLYYLFKSFTSSFYGIESWSNKIPQYQMNYISVAYHKAIKKIAGLNVWDSNHLGCERVGVSLFKHLLARRLVCFWHNLWNSKSPCMANLSYYWRYRSCLFKRLSAMFLNEYAVDIADNPLCAVLSRIDFTQRHEPRSHYGEH